MTLSAETPPSAVVRMLALEIQSGARFLNSLQGTAKKLAADLDAQERLMAEMIAALRAIASCESHVADDVVGIARALLARIEGKPHAD